MWMDWDTSDADWAKPVDERKSYFTMSNENNYTIWSFLKKCHTKGMVYRGYDAMPWCGRCGVGLSEMEVKEGYKTIEHRAVFVKFPLRDRPGENLLAWTTTPWTLTSNVAAAVNPELTYLRVKLKGEVYYVAKGAFKINRMESSGDEDGEPGASAPGVPAKKSKRDWLDSVPHLKSIEQLFKEKAGKDGFEIAGEVKGADMLGWAYTGPFDDLDAQGCECGYPIEVARVAEARQWTARVAAKAVHRVIAWKDVGETEGTGIVHIAPGCGQADFELGKENKLPPVAPLDDAGCFHPGFGPLAGKNAVESSTADSVFELLKAKDLLFATERYVHRYPHCWRCKTELLFRLVDEWFIGMGSKPVAKAGEGEHWHRDAFRTQIKNVAAQVTFLPESLSGQKREIDWLRNMGDWMISKKRFWGLALPIWTDEATGEFEVIGSYAELKERAVEGWQEFDGHSPHRPFVDRVKIRSKTTGALMSRIPDVGNPWLDAGIVGFSTLKYNSYPDYWMQWYPADFITESFPGQFRNWFYALLALSTMMSDGEPPFKTLLGFATVKDQYGHDMHKSAGNSIEFIAAADKGGTIKDPKGNDVPFTAIGADVMRWLYCRQSPAQNLNFGPEPANEVRSKFIFKLWNTYALFCNCAIGDGYDPASMAQQVLAANRSDIDRWILSCLQVLIQTARDSFEKYDAMTFALAAERFVDDDLSNWYVRRVKGRLNSKVADLDAAGLRDKWAAYRTMHGVLTTLCQCIAPCVPFIAETMWKGLGGAGASVHLSAFPEADESLIDTGLMEQMDALREIITLGGAARNAAKIKVRQPLAELVVAGRSQAVNEVVRKFPNLICDELNVKEVALHDPIKHGELKFRWTLKKKELAKRLGSSYTAVESAFNNLHECEKTSLGFKDQTIDFEVAGILEKVTIASSEVTIDSEPVAGYAKAGYPTVVMVSTTITEELKLEGMARDVIRLVNQSRKDAGLEIADLIALYLHSPAEQLAKALLGGRGTIATETQAGEWSDTPLSPAGHASDAKVDGLALRIEFRKL